MSWDKIPKWKRRQLLEIDRDKAIAVWREERKTRSYIIPTQEFRDECPFDLPSDEVYLSRGWSYAEDDLDQQFLLATDGL